MESPSFLRWAFSCPSKNKFQNNYTLFSFYFYLWFLFLIKNNIFMNLQSMIDVTKWAALSDYLTNDINTIALIEVVDESLGLVEVAERFCSCGAGEDEKQNAWQVKTWLQSGQIKKNSTLDRRMAVDVIRIEPFFIFKSLKKFYE